MKHLLILHPVSRYALERMARAAQKNDWALSIVTIPSSTVGDGLPSLRQWVRVPKLVDDPQALRESVHGMKLDAIVPGNEFAVIASDVLARELGLPCNDPAQIKNSRSKVLMRRAFEAAGVPQPRMLATLSETQPLSSVDWSGLPWPVIVKPADMAMSLFVRLCANHEEAAENIAAMFAFKTSRLTNYAFEATAVIEEYVEGPEFSLECIVQNAKVIACFPTQKFVSPLPSCFETGHANADSLNPALGRDAQDVAQRVANSWQLEAGVMHVEVKATRTGLMVIEAGCRVAGGHISDLVEGRHGVSLEEALMKLRLGESAIPLLTAASQGEFHAVKFIFPQTVHREPPESLRMVQAETDPAFVPSGAQWSVNQRAGYRIVAGADHSQLTNYVASS